LPPPHLTAADDHGYFRAAICRARPHLCHPFTGLPLTACPSHCFPALPSSEMSPCSHAYVNKDFVTMQHTHFSTQHRPCSDPLTERRPSPRQQAACSGGAGPGGIPARGAPQGGGMDEAAQLPGSCPAAGRPRRCPPPCSSFVGLSHPGQQLIPPVPPLHPYRKETVR
jgi:hypothetical protein